MFFATEGLTVYNISQLGGSETGSSSQFYIDPLPGYTVSANQFSADTPGVSDPYSSVSFQNTTIAGAANNRVLVKVIWDGTTTLTEDYVLNLNIYYDSSIPSSQSLITDLSYIFQLDLGYSNISISSLDLDVVNVLNYQASPNNTSGYNVSCSVLAGETSLVGQFSIDISSPSTQFFEQDIAATVAGGLMQAISGGGPYNPSFSFEYEYVNNSFGNPQSVIVKVFYEAEEDPAQDDGAIVTILAPTATSYYFNWVTSTGQISTSVEVDPTASNYTYYYQTNIPNPANNLTAQFSNTDLTTLGPNGLGDNTLSVTVSVLPVLETSRTGNITMQDIYYSNSEWGSNDTLVINQNEEDFITLQLSTDIVGNNYTFSSNDSNVISNPNTSWGFNQLAVNQNYYDQSPFEGDITYRLVVQTNASITQEEVTNAISVTQTGYPIGSDIPSDWVDFEVFSWESYGPGLWRRDFYIRNNDTTSDRIATITFTHPDDAGVTDTISIRQDGTYDSAVDTVQLKVSYSEPDGSNSGSSAYGDATANTSLYTQVSSTVKIKMGGYENSFNLPNDTNNDPSETDIYKQYSRPRFFVQHSGQANSQNQDLINPSLLYDAFYEFGEVTYNEDYDALDSNNDHQYEVPLTIYSNNTAANRWINVFVFHSQNNSTNLVDRDALVQIKQTSQDVVVLIDNNIPLGSSTGLQYSGTAITDYFQLYFNGTTPTIGLWNNTTQTYTALSAGSVTANGFSYSTPVEDQGASSSDDTSLYNFNISFTQNTPLANRSETIGIWHSNATPASDVPNVIVNFQQLALAFDPEIFSVSFYDTNPFTIDNDGETLTYKIIVDDYTQDDFDTDSNIPIVSVEKVSSISFPALGEIVNDSEGIIESITVAKNGSWTSGSGTHTHTATVVYNSYSGNSIQYFCARVKHAYNVSDIWQDTTTAQMLPDSYLYINTIANGILGTLDVTNSTTNYTLSLPSDSSVLWPSFSIYNLTDYNNSNYVYSYGYESYIFARFLNDSEETIEDTSNGILSETDMYSIVPRTSSTAVWYSPFTGAYANSGNLGDIQNNFNNAIYDAGTGDSLFLFGGTAWPSMTVNENTGSARSCKIGFWTGQSAPKTNLIDTEQSPAPTFTYNGNIATFSTAIYSSTYFPQCFTATTDGFDWNPQTNNATTQLTSGDITQNDYIVAKFDISESITSNSDEYAIEFTVSNLQYLFGPDVSIGINSGWFSSPFGDEQTNDLFNYLKVNQNGTYAARLTGLSGGAKVEFLLRRNAKFSISNVKFWKIEKDAKLEVDQVITSTSPSFVLTINQEAAPALGSIAFPNGSPAQGYSPINDISTSQYDFRGIWGLSSNNALIHYGVSVSPGSGNYSMNNAGELIWYDYEPSPNNLKLSIKTVDSSTGEPWSNPYARLWNGSNYYDDDNFLVYSASQWTPQGHVGFRISPNYEETVKTYTIGFWPAVPSSSTVAPTITQVVKVYPYGYNPM